MKIGSMRHRITIQRYTATTDNGGGSSVVWNDVADVFAHIDPAKVDDQRFAEQIREVTTHVITVRYRSDLSHKDRLFHSVLRNGEIINRTFAIRGIKNVSNQNRFLELACEEGVPT